MVAIKSALEVQLLQEKKANDELGKECAELQDQLGIAKTEVYSYTFDIVFHYYQEGCKTTFKVY